MSSNIVVVAHGKSEVILWKNLGMRMKVGLNIYSRKNGEETVAISHLPELFMNGDLSTERKICDYFRDMFMQWEPKEKKKIPGL